MDTDRLRHIASQLRQPQGEAGIETGQRMNVGNELIYQRAIAQLAIQPGDHILELGPGNGFFARQIVATDSSVRYTGCDLSETMIAEAGRLNEEFVQDGQVELVLRDRPALPFADAAFDKVFTINTLYFWDDPSAELAEIRRVLMPDGLLIVGIRPRHIMEQMPFVTFGFTLYEPNEAADLLTANGFGVTNLIVEPEPDQTFFGKAIRMETVLVCARPADN